TEKGKSQAKTIASLLRKKIKAGEKIVICSSTAKRAKVTADIIFNTLRQEFDCQRCEKESFPDLCEGSSGEWEGKPYDTNYEKEMKIRKQLSAKEKYIKPILSGGESYQAVVERVLPCIQKIVDKHPGKLVFIVTHGRVMRATSLYWRGLVPELSSEPRSVLPELKINNGDILIVEKQIKQPISQARVMNHLTTFPKE
ncbi:MAG TPA: histidine phosphatase family protein, partial [Chlamydiales bacterium]|nr:histidine phosphatase family protein [Chlamydiales bacterium]